MVSHHPDEREISAANRNEITTAGSNEIYSPAVGKFLPGSGGISPRQLGVFLPGTGEDWAALPSFGLNQSPQEPQPQHTSTQCACLKVWVLKCFANYLKEKKKHNVA